jgi:hypothetical protein
MAMKRVCRVQYVSDIHLEHFPATKFTPFSDIVKPAAPILCLAGDIGNPLKPHYGEFLRYCASGWDHVFVVAGNHEHYNLKPKKLWENSEIQALNNLSSAEQQVELCRDICNEWSNVHFLEKESHYLPSYNVEFLGCTLWTKIPPANDWQVMSAVNDYKFITDKSKNSITPTLTNNWHEQTVRWLTIEIDRCEQERKHVVVLSHHLPTELLINKRYKGSKYNCAFYSDLDMLLQGPIRAWICGHSHHHVQMMVGDEEQVILGLNAYGYLHEERENFNAEQTLEFSCGPWSESSLSFGS